MIFWDSVNLISSQLVYLSQLKIIQLQIREFNPLPPTPEKMDLGNYLFLPSVQSQLFNYLYLCKSNASDYSVICQRLGFIKHQTLITTNFASIISLMYSRVSQAARKVQFSVPVETGFWCCVFCRRRFLRLYLAIAVLIWFYSRHGYFILLYANLLSYLIIPIDQAHCDDRNRRLSI